MSAEGWLWVWLDSDWHYFIGSVCLCGKWGHFARQAVAAKPNGAKKCPTCIARLTERPAMKARKGA